MKFPSTARFLTGLVVPVGALRGKENLGVGEFLDLVPLAEFCRKHDIALIQLLPVNDTGFQSSPYSSLTAFGLNPLYISISALPGSKLVKDQISAIRQKTEYKPRFSYGPVLSDKLALLRQIYDADEKVIAKESVSGPLATWIAENSWVKEYAVYRELKERHEGRHWKDWNVHQNPSAQDIEALWADPEPHRDQLFWVWLQRIADTQFSEAAQALQKAGIALKGDIPILMNEDSCDVWAHPEYFSRDYAAGAPPDMFSPLGQNWGFPIYNWDVLEKTDFSWWRQRLDVANRYYSAFRIDHVLGFFRIWAASEHDHSAVLGRFIPSLPINRDDLRRIGFDDARITWLSKPHIKTADLSSALNSSNLSEAQRQMDLERTCSKLLTRIGNEELWLFNENVRGERDIEAVGLDPALSGFLQASWRNRALLEFQPGLFMSTWSYRDTTSYPSLSEREKSDLDSLIQERRSLSEKIWEEQGKKILGTLVSSTPMLACAEDLGAVPDCVPRTLESLGILGLRVIRWARRWGENPAPFIPLSTYPELSVCTPAVHDSSTVREWWECEAEKDLFRSFIGEPTLSDAYSPDNAKKILSAVSRSNSRLCVFQIQDLLHLSPRWYATDAASERVNVPGTVNDFNWTYRLPASIEELSKDTDLSKAIKNITAKRQEHR